eukprot:TRINITY_DN19410_c0_g1_i1.p1 TRINITY_DN19410_c0_g1~~TRINITY_DN19410_c0_g1_i1.p1  ORF type:complete len:117 (-),score=2.25 TRINITY_DN19410_c0_g1_i1:34-384(-)
MCIRDRYYNAQTGAIATTGCKSCPAGTYNPNPAAAWCINCPANTYNPDLQGDSVDACLPCESSVSPVICTKCKPGTYNNGTGQSACHRCASGYYDSSITTGSVSYTHLTLPTSDLV